MFDAIRGLMTLPDPLTLLRPRRHVPCPPWQTGEGYQINVGRGAHAAIPRFRLSVRPLEPINNFEFDEGTPVSEETLRIAAPSGGLANLLTNSDIGARKRAADRTEAEHD